MGTVLPLVVVSVAYHSQRSLASLAADLGRHQGGLARWIVVDQAPQSAPLDPEPLRRHLGSVPLLVLQGLGDLSGVLGGQLWRLPDASVSVPAATKAVEQEIKSPESAR